MGFWGVGDGDADASELGDVLYHEWGDFDSKADPPSEPSSTEVDCMKLCQKTSNECTAWEYGWYGNQGVGGYYCVLYSGLVYGNGLEDIGGTGDSRSAYYAGLCYDDVDDVGDYDNVVDDYDDNYNAEDYDDLASSAPPESKPESKPSKQPVPSSSDTAGAQSKPVKQPVVTGPPTNTNGTSNTTATASSAAYPVGAGAVTTAMMIMLTAV
jgi:hypothetical protein